MRYKKHALIVSVLFFIIVTALFVRSALSLTWSSDTAELTSYSFFDGYPSIMQARDGKVWFTWTRTLNGYKAILYKTSSDMGHSWSLPQNLTEVPSVYEYTKPVIMQAMNGSLWLVYSSNCPPPPPPPKPDFSLSATPNSLTIPLNSMGTSTITVTSLHGFNSAVNLAVSGAPAGVEAVLNPVQVTPPPNGNVNSTLTITVGGSATPGDYTLTVSGTSTSLPPVVRRVNISLHIVAMGGLGNALQTGLVITKLEPDETYDYEIYYQTSPDNGATWSNRIQLTKNVVDDLAPTILQLRNGTIFVFYGEFVNGDGNDEIFYKYSSDGGVNWTTVQLTSNTDTDSYPSAIETNNGNIWVVWHSERSLNYDLYYRIYNGFQWSAETRLTHGSEYDLTPSLIETLDGVKHVFWTVNTDDPDAKDDIYYSYTSNNGASWSTPVLFTSVDAFNDDWPWAALMRDTSVWIAWSSDMSGNYEIYYRTSLVGDLTGPENPPGSGSYPPDGAIDLYDLTFMRKAYGMKQGNPGWSQYGTADITGVENPLYSLKYPPDGVVSVYDLFALGKNYGKT